MQYSFSPQNTLIIRNPVSGRFFSRRRAAKLESMLSKQGYTVVHTRQPGHATQIARDFARTPDHGIILIGGDGTVMEAVQELPSDIPLAVFPTGTVNLLARALGVPAKIKPWLSLLKQGTLQPAYGATCNGHALIGVASTGLTAQTVENVNPRLKKWIQEFAYAVSAFLGFFRYKNPKWQIEIDGVRVQEPVLGMVSGLGPHYGGPNVIFPEADIARPSISYCLLKGRNKWLLWKYVFGMLTGKLPKMQGLHYGHARVIRIESDSPMSVEVDGDFYGYTPVDICVDTQPRCILAPPSAQAV